LIAGSSALRAVPPNLTSIVFPARSAVLFTEAAERLPKQLSLSNEISNSARRFHFQPCLLLQPLGYPNSEMRYVEFRNCIVPFVEPTVRQRRTDCAD
jgi:hypothetical protein